MDYNLGRALVVLVMMAFTLGFCAAAGGEYTDPTPADEGDHMWRFAIYVLLSLITLIGTAAIAGIPDSAWEE